MLRIDERTGGHEAVLQVEGKLMGVWVAELRGALLARAARQVSLDLSGLSFMDGEGVALLDEWSRRGVRLVNCSPFARARLRQIGIGCEAA